MTLAGTVQARDVVAGVGFRHSAEPAEIVELVLQAFAAADLPVARLRAFATASDRAGDPTFRAAAAELGVEAVGLAASALHSVDERVVTRSDRIEVQRGVGSLAEAAALAAAGPGAVLILPRLKTPTATCALALVRGSL